MNGRDWLRVLLLEDYNTRVVLLGTMLLGLAGGLVGVFLLLRRRSLAADVVSHATFPGIALAFLIREMIAPGTGKSTPTLLLGALVTGVLGLACTTLVRKWTRLHEDAAFALVLSVFFGCGVALFRVIQAFPAGNAAGLEHFLYGKTASMVAADVWWIAGMSCAVIVAFALLFKELTLVCFDEEYAAAQGWPVWGLDLLLLGLVASVTVIGLQSVGMLLVVALLVTPAAAARCWTRSLGPLTWISALIGVGSAVVGVMASALLPRLAAGAVIVLAGTGAFIFSVAFGFRSGVVTQAVLRWLRNRQIARDDLLRAIFEVIEPRCDRQADQRDELLRYAVPFSDLRARRSWSPSRLQQLIRRAQRDGLLVDYGELGVKLTERGAALANQLVRNHRLWELYLIEYAARSPQRVDRDADRIEHFLDPALVHRLEQLLVERSATATERVPPSPHAIPVPGATGGEVGR